MNSKPVRRNMMTFEKLRFGFEMLPAIIMVILVSNFGVKGDHCVSDCTGVPDGGYPSCLGCHVYAICSNGIIQDNVQCPAKGNYSDDESTGTHFEYFAVFPRTAMQENATEVRRLLITKLSIDPTTVNITNVMAATTESIDVEGEDVVIRDYPTDLTLAENNTITNKVLRIKSDSAISVHTLVSSIKSGGFQARDSFLLLPTSKLCEEYILITPSDYPQFNVIAANNAFVEMVLSNGDVIEKTLNENMVFTQLYGPSIDLTGSRIVSNNSIAVFSGGFFSRVPRLAGGNRDMNAVQLTCPDNWKQDCIMGPYKPRDGFVYKIVARDNNTAVNISITGRQDEMINLDGSEKYEEFLMPDSERTVVVVSDKPVLVAQFSLNNVDSNDNNADSSMVLCVSPDEYQSEYRFYTPAPNRDTYLRITIKSQFKNDTMLNGEALTPFDTIDLTGPGGDPYTILYSSLTNGTYNVLNTVSNVPFGAVLSGINGIGATQYTHNLGRK